MKIEFNFAIDTCLNNSSKDLEEIKEITDRIMNSFEEFVSRINIPVKSEGDAEVKDDIKNDKRSS